MYYSKGFMKTDMVPFKAGQQFEFRPGINLITGDQGCGKSTLIHMLMKHNKKTIKIKGVSRGDHYTAQSKYIDGSFKELKDEYYDVFGTEMVKPFTGDYEFFDTEFHNPRVMNGDSSSRTGASKIRDFINFCADKMGDNFVQSMESVFPLFMENEEKDGFSQMDMIRSKFKSHGQVLFPILKTISEKKNGVIFLDEPETSLSIRSQYAVVDAIKTAEQNGCQLFIATHSPVLMDAVGQVLSLEHGAKWVDSSWFMEQHVGSR